MQEEPIIRDGALDSQNLCFYDPNIDGYQCYSRYFARPIDWESEPQDGEFREVSVPDTLDDLGVGIRAIQNTCSKDFLHWQPLRANCYQHHIPLEHFYTNATFLCPGAEQLLHFHAHAVYV